MQSVFDTSRHADIFRQNHVSVPMECQMMRHAYAQCYWCNNETTWQRMALGGGGSGSGGGNNNNDTERQQEPQQEDASSLGLFDNSADNYFCSYESICRNVNVSALLQEILSTNNHTTTNNNEASNNGSEKEEEYANTCRELYGLAAMEVLPATTDLCARAYRAVPVACPELCLPCFDESFTCTSEILDVPTMGGLSEEEDYHDDEEQYDEGEGEEEATAAEDDRAFGDDGDDGGNDSASSYEEGYLSDKPYWDSEHWGDSAVGMCSDLWDLGIRIDPFSTTTGRHSHLTAYLRRVGSPRCTAFQRAYQECFWCDASGTQLEAAAVAVADRRPDSFPCQPDVNFCVKKDQDGNFRRRPAPYRGGKSAEELVNACRALRHIFLEDWFPSTIELCAMALEFGPHCSCTDDDDDDDPTNLPYLGATTRNEKKLIVTVSRIAAVLSMVGAMYILWDSLSNKNRRRMVHHQLLVGMACFDICTAVAWAFATTPIPSEEGYYVWGARGTSGTCTAQAFFYSAWIYVCLLQWCPGHVFLFGYCPRLERIHVCTVQQVFARYSVVVGMRIGLGWPPGLSLF